ncbi:MAG: von Willebrand factor type A domain-containing protein [Gemmatimonadetes bacterium]|nr:von Willebrand factor type A domain-containing protein [Gemmatimonadota bacterium]
MTRSAPAILILLFAVACRTAAHPAATTDTSAGAAEAPLPITPKPFSRERLEAARQDMTGPAIATPSATNQAAWSRITTVPASTVPAPPPGNREQYTRITDHPFVAVAAEPRATFSTDVDRASYGNVRRFLMQGQRPPTDAVRVEELLNYFPYDLAAPRGDAPLAVTTEVIPAPWEPRHQLLRVALQARRIAVDALPPAHLVFLVDVSGSMMDANKLPLVQQALRLLVEQLRPQDRVALVTYASGTAVRLESTPGSEKARIMAAIDGLEAGGGTAGEAGLELAYRVARTHSVRGGNTRVILATDGDFNLGPSSDAEMERLVERRRAEGTSLTVLGVGTGNYQDAKMKAMAKAGNGNYAYLDDLAEARKQLVEELGGTLVTVANDAKLQLEFNPAAVRAYRLIGYEGRRLRDQEFADDRKDAGDIGAGHTVTALVEIVPAGVSGTVDVPRLEPHRYQAPDPVSAARNLEELAFVRLRYKVPGEAASRLLEHPVRAKMGAPSADMRFAAAVATWGMLLRDAPHRGSASPALVRALARDGVGEDRGGYRREFLELVERWVTLPGTPADASR